MRWQALSLLLAVSAFERGAFADPAPSAPPASASPESMALTAPVLRSSADVPYPDGAKGDATVTLIVVVNADGSVRSAKADEPNEPFSSAAEAAALTWRFDPAKRGEKEIAARIRFEIAFHPPAPPAPPPSDETAPAPKSAPPNAPAAPRADVVEDVTVRGAHAEASRTVSLSRTEVRQIPGAFGDPFRALEIMPGVTPIVSGLPYFFVRGAPPGDVGYFLDGIRVPYLFHVGIGPSVVNPGIVDTVDLYPGGYPARFGRFSGGIVSGETVAPKPELHGEYNLRVYDAGLLVETPFDDGRGTILLAGRYSFTGLVLSLVSPNTVLQYWDYQGRLSYDLTKRDRISLFAFGAYDFLGNKTPTSTITLFGTHFHRLDLRYDHRIDADTTIRTAVTGGLDLTDLGDGRTARDRLAAARSEVTFRLSEDVRLRFGTDMEADRYDVVLALGSLAPSDATLVNLYPSRTDFASGARADFILNAGRLEVVPGARVDFYASEGVAKVALDPRLQLRTRVNGRVKLLSAFGIAHQAPSFSLPLPGIQPGGLQGGLQTAIQESTGVEVDLGHSTIATLTGFHNGFFNLSDALSDQPASPDGCPAGTFPGDVVGGDRGAQPTSSTLCTNKFTKGTLGPDRSGGEGQAASGTNDLQSVQALETRANGNAYGIELFIKRKLTEHVGGFLSYTLSRSTRTVGNQSFVAEFDRTHVFNAALAFDLGRNWRAGTRVVFYTGLPQAPEPGSTSTRLDPFFRLDLRLEKRWQLSPKRWISFVAEWQNATLSKEDVGTNCTLNGCQAEKIGPVTIPSVGVEGGF